MNHILSIVHCKVSISTLTLTLSMEDRKSGISEDLHINHVEPIIGKSVQSSLQGLKIGGVYFVAGPLVDSIIC